MKIKWIIRHFVRVFKHKAYLFHTGRKFGVSYYSIIVHDLSKFSLTEIRHYSRQFFAPDEEKNWDEFRRGWHHHVMRNPHHWEYWVLSGRSVEKPMEMPEKFAREMVADWMAASRAYTGSWDMHRWLCKNWNKVKLHPNTREFVLELLKNSGHRWWLFPKAN